MEKLVSMNFQCSSGPLGPYILDGRYNRRHRGDARIRSGAEYHLVFMDDGIIQYHYQGHLHELQPPGALLVAPGTDFELTLARGITWHDLCFDAVYQSRQTKIKHEKDDKFVCSFVHKTDRPQPPPEQIWGTKIGPKVPEPMLDGCRALIRWCNAHWWRDAQEYARANYYLGLWLLDLADWHQGRKEDNDSWLGRMQAYCRANIIHGLTVEELARHAGTSRQQLRTRMIAEAGMSPKAFLDSFRFDEACRLLRSTGEPLARISKYCGYTSPTIFTRRFREMSGLSPRAWRQQQQI